ncbi:MULTISPECIES: aldo/keto reductase [unclassified Brevundimonas]|uniref:aldo/keto reductase n=1 Tax=unclassified Brevundimonas TaxID=2622653 RepID=UPI0025B984DE|nr:MULTISPECIES: aldo/keto reductase [unclassified Brevundimonas]
MRFVDSHNPVDRLALAVAVEPDRLRPMPLRHREDAVRQILQTAADAGISMVATKPEGDSERLLGQSWPFPSPFRVSVRTVSLTEGIDRAEARARRSLEHMGLPRGEVVLVQNAGDLAGAEGRALWDRLQALKDRGLFRKIGFIASIEDNPAALARRFRPDVVQLPCNVLDQRALKNGTIDTLAEHDVAVHLSSVFAKGLLFSTSDRLPEGYSVFAPSLSRVRRRLAEARVDPMQAALTYALNLPGVERVIAKVNSAAQLRAILAASYAPCPDVDWSSMALEESSAALSARLRVGQAA